MHHTVPVSQNQMGGIFLDCKTRFQLKHQIITFGNIYANELVIMCNSALSSVVSVLAGSKLLYQTKTNRGK